MATITVPGMFLTGDHASRPAATAVGGGSIYSCTDHALIYQSDGASWSTWADLSGTGGSVATDAIWDAAGDLAVGTGANTAARLPKGANGTGVGVQGGTAAYYGTMHRIGQTVVGAATGTITFSSIPADYENLRLTLMGRGTVSALNAEVLLQFNADTGSNYSLQAIQEVAATVSGAVNTGTTITLGYLAGATNTANHAGSLDACIIGYARTVFFKLIQANSGGQNFIATNQAYQYRVIGQWASTAAITTITLTLTSGNFDTGTVATLYGTY